MPVATVDISSTSNLDDLLSALVEGKLPEEEEKRVGDMLRDEARHHWDNREEFRLARSDARNLYRGRQWEESVKDLDTGAIQTEKEYIEGQGRVAIIMNIVANTVNNIDGQFRQNKSGRLAFAVESEDNGAVEMMNLARRAVRRYNESEVIEADQFREHLISGAAGFKSTIRWDPRLQRHEIRDAEVDQTKFFYNLDIHDRRLNGLRLIGELHDTTVNDAIHKFARNTGDAEKIRAEYDRVYNDQVVDSILTDFSTFDSQGFTTPNDPSLIRIIEVWRPAYRWVRHGLDPLFELIPEGVGEISIAENQITRIQNERRENFEQGMYPGFLAPPLLELDESRYDPFWHFFFISPEGTLLKFGPTPYLHGEHPYSPGLALLIDGETWGVMANIKDPQRWLNRVLIHIDNQLSSGGQGMLGVDEDIMKASNLTPSQVAEQYGRPQGVLSLKKGNKTWDSIMHQYEGRGIQSGWLELIPMLMQFNQDISGVSAASKGESPTAGTPASLYQQQIVQANMNVLSYLDTYFETLKRKDVKELKLTQQAFQEPRQFAGDLGKSTTYDPEKVRNLEWDVAMGDVTDTAIYRQLWEGDLKDFLTQGFFGPPGPQAFMLYLEASSHPQADLLKQIITQAMGGAVSGMDAGAADPSQILAQLQA